MAGPFKVLTNATTTRLNALIATVEPLIPTRCPEAKVHKNPSSFSLNNHCFMPITEVVLYTANIQEARKSSQTRSKS